MTTPVLRRVVRRETHSPRTVAMIIAVVLVILALVYVGTEIVLSVLGQPALLLGPGAALAGLAGLPTEVPQGVSIAVGVVLAIIGLILVVLAVKPGRLPRHSLAVGDRAVVVDNGVIASAVAQRVSDETGFPRDQVRVGVSHRTVDVVVEPAFGVDVDDAQVRSIAATEVDSYGLTPSVTTKVRVQRAKKEADFR